MNKSNSIVASEPKPTIQRQSMTEILAIPAAGIVVLLGFYVILLAATARPSSKTIARSERPATSS
ncbi:hypothetical protein AB9F38_35635, partial [Rhizobium leguminosarum]